MSSPPLFDAVADIVSKVAQIDRDKITPESDLKTDFGVDSLTGLKIVAALEKKFGIQVPDEEVDFYTSMKSIVGMLEKLLAAAANNSPEAV